ncbi:hypothetical protein NXZ75_04750 [Lysinibacillus sphaericus]|uniref:hypothetical protein n=1 Tax=Lysinibacillus sphaericus TaxID=1421 RepID=UPI0021635026|nr:hypothetical protein [Lysinibacillus sphaericus]MCS1381495.1 hypothetical protein [Lysinibacillus sphaericus]
MNNTAFLFEEGYCTNIIKDAHLLTNSVTLEIPINDTVSQYDICKFKLIVEEVKNETQLLLDSSTLGEKITEVLYNDVTFIEEDFICYMHENNLELQKQSQNKVIQQAFKEGAVSKKNAYRKNCPELKGDYNIKIQIFRHGIQKPEFLSSEAPLFLTDYEQKIETVTVYVLIFKNSIDIYKNKNVTKSTVYGGLGHLGFFMVDLKLFSEFIRSEVGDEPLNLVELFTTTNLVDKCFEEGILIVTWGIKPWHYYIQAMNNSILLDECIVKGTYKIKNEIKELSVIPGDELLTWPACLEKKWPTIRLEGTGEKIDLTLCTWSGALGNEIIPMYILERSEERIENVNPIINYSFI